MEPQLTVVRAMMVVGLEVRTSNRDEMDRATARIPGIWGRFYRESVTEAVPGRTETGGPLAVYSHYESDHTGPYSLLVGVEMVEGGTPTGMARVDVVEGRYLVFPARGAMPQSVMDTWKAIWDYFATNAHHERAYTTDFEQYRGADVVDIHIAVK